MPTAMIFIIPPTVIITPTAIIIIIISPTDLVSVSLSVVLVTLSQQCGSLHLFHCPLK